MAKNQFWDPDPVGPGLFFVESGSGNFDRIQIRIRPPKSAYYQSEKVIYSHRHFQYRHLSFSSNPEKNLRTFGQNYLKQREFELFITG
jgi:hypothetical protein